MGKCHRGGGRYIEMVSMTDREINNKMIGITGKLWHEREDMRGLTRTYTFDYTIDLNLVREVELKLVEEGLLREYRNNLCIGDVLTGESLDLLVIADARTRCLAIIKTKEDNK